MKRTRPARAVSSGGVCGKCGQPFSTLKLLKRHRTNCNGTRDLTIADRAHEEASSVGSEQQLHDVPNTEEGDALPNVNALVNRLTYTYGQLLDIYRIPETALQQVMAANAYSVNYAVEHFSTSLQQTLPEYKALITSAQEAAYQAAMPESMRTVFQVKSRMEDLAQEMVCT